MRPLRIYVAGLEHETNSFSPLPTSLKNFEEDICYRPGDPTARDKALSFPGYGDLVAVGRARGDIVVEGPCFSTQPSGPASAACYAQLRDEVLDGLRDGPFDMVIFHLHGAMMARGTNDCEGDLLQRARKLVGPDVPIGAILDLHGNISRRMVQSGAILIGVKEYPHIDFRPRAEELHAILAGMARNRLHPTVTVRTIPMLSLQGTTEDPMRGIVQDLKTAETRDGILSVSLMHGFPWADWDEAGASVIIVSDGASLDEVTRLADTIADRFVTAVSSAPVRRFGVAEAMREAMREARRGRPVVIADSSDNPGGGAGCDSTFLLREMLDRGVDNAALGMMWDPQAAQIAASAGIGSRIPLRLGGKVGPLSGDPVDIEGQVLCIRADARQRNLNGDPVDALGLAVAIRAGGVDIVVNSIRQQVFSPECFTELGVDVAEKAIVGVESSQHFRAGFDPIAHATIYCDAPGTLNMNLGELPYRNIQLAACGSAFSVDRPPSWLRSSSPLSDACQPTGSEKR